MTSFINNELNFLNHAVWFHLFALAFLNQTEQMNPRTVGGEVLSGTWMIRHGMLLKSLQLDFLYFVFYLIFAKGVKMIHTFSKGLFKLSERRC